MSDYERLHIAYFYDLALPSQLAAPIQILQTCHAICRLGATATLYVNRIAAASVAECLAFYGLAPHPRLKIVPWYAAGPATQARIRQLLAAQSRDQALVLISRGEPGLDLFGRLPRKLPPGCGLIYEAHRLCFPEVAQRVRADLPPPLRAILGGWRTARTRAAEQHALRRADGILCLTNGVRAALEHTFGIQRPQLVLPSGTTLPTEAPPDDRSRDIDVLYAGKLERRKGVHDLIAALAHIAQARLWIVGGSPAEIAPFRRLAEDLGVDARITFTGFVPPAEVEPLYRRARVGVCPLPQGESAIADQYTSPLKVLAMMAHGSPIVATDVAPLREILDDTCAAFAAPNQPAQLAQAIQLLLGDRRQAQELAHNAWVRSREYSWERRATRLLEFAATLDGSRHNHASRAP
ncbi:MAG: glycosyltransferase family 4 protein [Oscillochloris sp.]|nr:glycosyltransferase family 4 protein [Oscillochloris sp.]